jgi:hypothetical protein
VDVKVIFVSPPHGFFMHMVSLLVQAICGSRWAHVAGVLGDGIFESVLPEVMISPLDKYDNCQVKEIITVHVSEKGYLAMIDEARRMIEADTKYSILDGLMTGLAALFGYRVLRMFSRFDSMQATHCSGTWSHLLRVGGVPVLPECSISQISPQDLYSFLKIYNLDKETSRRLR